MVIPLIRCVSHHHVLFDKVQLQHNDNKMKDNTRRSIIEQLFGYQDIESLRESNTTIARRSLLPQNCFGLAAALSSFWIFLQPPQLWARWFLMTCVWGEKEESQGELIITEWRQSHHFLIEPSASDRWRMWSAAAAWCGPLWSLKIWAEFPLKSPAAEPQRALIENKREALRSPPAHARPLWGGLRWWVSGIPPQFQQSFFLNWYDMKMCDTVA